LIGISALAKAPSAWSRSGVCSTIRDLKQSAFIAETPIDEPGDDRRNVNILKQLVT
jgi:hypothetical protein